MKQTNYESAVELINQGIESLQLEEQETEVVYDLLELVEEGYILIEWPESQEYMEQEWFDEEAILALGSEDKTGSSAYFIPIKRLLSML